MASDIDRILERVRQNTEARMARIARQRSSDNSRPMSVTAAHTLGARVFDPLTGQEGTVVGGGSENVVVQAPGR